VPVFAIVGGGEAGAFYVRQLRRAAAAGRASVESLVVVDRDPACAVARERSAPDLAFVCSDWGEWLDAQLDALPPGAQLVPYHWAPHLLREWLERQLRRRGVAAGRGGRAPGQGVPWESALPSGDRALSYATWTCPATCIEPALCPHTGGPKDWSLAEDLERPRAGDGGLTRVVFRALHYAYGVGTIPVAEILAARDRMLAAAAEGPREYLVATSSHCHALAATLRTGTGGPLLDIAERP
jgi:hypothetical protein